MRPDAAQGMHCEPEHGSGHCITCSDEAIPLTVVTVDDARGLARCESAAGESTTVEVALIGPVAPGDGLLAHAGTAIARVPAPQVGASATAGRLAEVAL